MYDRGTMQRAASYSYPAYPEEIPQKHYPTAHSTSSAFSASANPNEDWTKISDLAERRRIQNRIAQRNYRKKLKKRLEDLERRAGSSSASPEQKHEELAPLDSVASSQATHSPASRARSSSSLATRDRTPEILQHYMLPSSDSSMFQQTYTRQMSTSPPPFNYGITATTAAPSYASYSQTPAYCSLPGSGMEIPLYPQYIQSVDTAYAHTMPTHPAVIKSEWDDEISPFAASYSTLAGMDASSAAYPYTPPLSDSFDHSQAGSPPDSAAYPHTPKSMPSPPMHLAQ